MSMLKEVFLVGMVAGSGAIVGVLITALVFMKVIYWLTGWSFKGGDNDYR